MRYCVFSWSMHIVHVEHVAPQPPLAQVADLYVDLLLLVYVVVDVSEF